MTPCIPAACLASPAAAAALPATARPAPVQIRGHPTLKARCQPAAAVTACCWLTAAAPDHSPCASADPGLPHPQDLPRRLGGRRVQGWAAGRESARHAPGGPRLGGAQRRGAAPDRRWRRTRRAPGRGGGAAHSRLPRCSVAPPLPGARELDSLKAYVQVRCMCMSRLCTSVVAFVLAVHWSAQAGQFEGAHPGGCSMHRAGCAFQCCWPGARAVARGPRARACRCGTSCGPAACDHPCAIVLPLPSAGQGQAAAGGDHRLTGLIEGLMASTGAGECWGCGAAKHGQRGRSPRCVASSPCSVLPKCGEAHRRQAKERGGQQHITAVGSMAAGIALRQADVAGPAGGAGRGHAGRPMGRREIKRVQGRGVRDSGGECGNRTSRVRALRSMQREVCMRAAWVLWGGCGEGAACWRRRQ